ncbi:hypothetical protein L4D17_17200, partial [Vibrio splendidus]
MMLFKLSPLVMLKFLSVGLAFITNVVLIKSIGTSDSGIYYTSLSYLSLAVPLGCMGFNNFILKKTSSGTNVQEVNFSIFLSLFNGFILIFFVSWILSYVYPDYFDYKLSYIVALNVPFLIFAENMSRYQQGLGYHKLSLLTVGIIQQVLMFLYFIFSLLLGFKVELSNVMCAYT